MDYSYIVTTIKKPNAIVTIRKYESLDKSLEFIKLQLKQNANANINCFRYKITVRNFGQTGES